jgi:hypothetical protein
LRDALVNDVDADFGQTIDVRFARPEVAAFDRVIEQAVNAVAIILIILCRVDAALRRDRVRAPGAVLIAETFDVIAEL